MLPETETPPTVAVAVIVVSPTAIAVTTPLLLTVATDGVDEDHDTVAAIGPPL